MENNDKYKMFRNFMANELGISKSDIEAWTKDATFEIAKKQVGQINFEGIVTKVIKDEMYDIRPRLVEKIAAQITNKILLQIKPD